MCHDCYYWYTRMIKVTYMEDREEMQYNVIMDCYIEVRKGKQMVGQEMVENLIIFPITVDVI